ncbi:Glycine-rich domain-containing protein-like protein [Dioscorea alata]|uniref:Glycine-rich domain-containing protein-like protein n=1 Tax=Dioscorea alata TaxID=55571 RepID=A0ACB7U8B4_DIOAL|nr:Glycine-rich domain-containing protein-like protein [Dioscorea alata]
MDKNQEIEWLEAQKITISEDLVATAKQQLEFLAEVDRRRCLYDGPVLERAIHRYKFCWLPLLAKYTESAAVDNPLVVPLDCEWIWHCHRLNPVQYKKDCKEFYGKMLDNKHVVSSLQSKGKSKDQTMDMWTKLFPEEPFDLNFTSTLSEININKDSEDGKNITYDLVSAVKRQSSFYYQVSRPSMHDDRFLVGAAARYKGFLHLIKRNQDRSLKQFCVPTYDIDLMWHSHQLHPLSYCKDMVKLLGKVLEHDDTDSDRSKGKKLDTGFTETTKQWEDSYGLRYWRAGAMYKGSLPSALPLLPDLSKHESGSKRKSRGHKKCVNLPNVMVVEVLMEIVGIRNLPSTEKGNLFVTFSKKQPDMFLDGVSNLTIFSETDQKQVAGFQCEATGHLVLALVSDSTSNLARSAKTIGTVSISLEKLLDSDSKLFVDDWFELRSHSGHNDTKPIGIHVAASFTVPIPAPHVLHKAKSNFLSTNTCFFPLPGKVQQFSHWTRFVHDNGNEIISLKMRNSRKELGKDDWKDKREIIGMTKFSRKPQILAEYAENIWSFKDSGFSIDVEKKISQDGHIFEFKGDEQIKLFLGRKLEYEPKNNNKQNDKEFITVVEFSTEHPYGKALALLSLKSGPLRVTQPFLFLIINFHVLNIMLS